MKNCLNTSAAKKTKTDHDDSKKSDTGDGSDVGDDMPGWAKKVFERFEGIEKKLGGLEADKVTGSRKSRLDDKLKDAPESVKNMIVKNFGKMKFDSDDDFTEYLTDVSAQVEEFAKDAKIDGMAGNGKSQTGNGGTGGSKTATKEELDAVSEKVVI